ncbi:MAG: hypothetical protein Q9195_007413 [Heterodermia aff. obscurata]
MSKKPLNPYPNKSAEGKKGGEASGISRVKKTAASKVENVSSNQFTFNQPPKAKKQKVEADEQKNEDIETHVAFRYLNFGSIIEQKSSLTLSIVIQTQIHMVRFEINAEPTETRLLQHLRSLLRFSPQSAHELHHVADRFTESPLATGQITVADAAGGNLEHKVCLEASGRAYSAVG